MTVKPNYRIELSRDFFSSEIKSQDPVSALREKVAKAHIQDVSLDKLHPKKSETPPHVEYVDQGLWRTRIEFKQDGSHFTSYSRIVAAGSTPHASLDALCEAELQRRFPHYQVIGGLKAVLKDKFPNLARGIMGTEQFYKQLTQKEVKKLKRQIAFSATNRDDMVSIPKIEDATLRRELKLDSDEVLRTEHVFKKNSPVNGQSYMQDGKRVDISQAIACSSDRKVENTGNLRVVRDAGGQSICYTGRVDSDRKVIEQASFMFFNELHGKGKGLTLKHENGQTVYEMDYVVNSMLSIPWYWSVESIIAPFPERAYIEEERKALMALQAKGPIELEDPNHPGMKYRVQFKPMLFSRSSNVFTRTEDWLPPYITGQGRSEEISEEGFAALKSAAMKRGVDTRVKRCLDALEQNLKKRTLTPQKEWLIRDYLCKLLDIPMVYHCKSSTDRTSVCVALSTALQHWIALDLPIPEKVGDLIDDYRFKELFAANWMAGHQVTRYARGAKGTVSGEKLNNKNLGLSLGRGVPQNPLVASLVPERYLTDFSTAQKVKMGAIALAVSLFIWIPLTLVSGIRQVFGLDPKKGGWKDKFSLPRLPLTLLTQFHTIFPSKVLNESSVQIGQRQLISGGKNKGKDDDES